MKDWKRSVIATMAAAAFVFEVASMVSNSLFPGHEQTLEKIAIILLFASMAFLIDTVAKKAEMLEEVVANQHKNLETSNVLASKVEELTEVGRQLNISEYAARYGSVGASLASLLAGSGRNVQSLAAARAIQPLALHLLPQLAQDISRTDAPSITMNGYSLIDKFTYEIMQAIPKGGAWLGVTHLAAEDAWKRDTATPDFFNWDLKIRERARCKEINVFRLYCYESKEHYNDMRDEIAEARKDGIIIKVFLPREDNFAPSDMSLLWAPTGKMGTAPALDAQNPVTSLNNNKDLSPVCALEFRTRGGKYLDQTTILARKDPRYDQLIFEFSRAWNEAADPA